jgi:hypothetical protein
MSQDLMKPSFHKTYRRADREAIVDYGWVTDLDIFDDDEQPVELIEETWRRTGARRFWHLPTALYSCEIEDQEPCEEDAIAWWRTPDGVWLQVCVKHATEEAIKP